MTKGGVQTIECKCRDVTARVSKRRGSSRWFYFIYCILFEIYLCAFEPAGLLWLWDPTPIFYQDECDTHLFNPIPVSAGHQGTILWEYVMKLPYAYRGMLQGRAPHNVFSPFRTALQDPWGHATGLKLPAKKIIIQIKINKYIKKMLGGRGERGKDKGWI